MTTPSLHKPLPTQKNNRTKNMYTLLHRLLKQEALHPGTVDKILLCQQIQALLMKENKNSEPSRGSVPAVKSLSSRSPGPALESESSRSNVPARGESPDPRSVVIAWYTGTLDRWRRSLRSPRPLAEIHPADRPRILSLINGR